VVEWYHVRVMTNEVVGSHLAEAKIQKVYQVTIVLKIGVYLHMFCKQSNLLLTEALSWAEQSCMYILYTYIYLTLPASITDFFFSQNFT
jgi:hypothetical protein